jgi:formate hydrogenlyase transcriptional activator
MIAAGASLTDILTNLCAAIDEQNPDMMSMVMLMDPDGQRLWPVAAPRVPRDFVKAISPLMIGENMSSCGTAAFRKERVIISDVATDPLRSGFQPRDIPLAHGLRATWSQPLLSKDNEVLGTFGLFHDTPRSPSARELRLIEDAGHIAVIAIEGERSQAALRKAFLEIRDSEQELRGILDAIRQTIVVLSPDGIPLYANRYILEYTGLTTEELTAPHGHFVHPEDVTRLQEVRGQGLARGVPFEAEYRVRRNDGQYRWSLIRYQPLCDEQGRILRWYATGTDIDDRKRAEERMRNENLALREDIDRASMFEEIVGSSPALQRVLAQAAKVAKTDSTVLVLGETGTGKELVARAIHRMSGRSTRAFIRVNCAAIPPSLIASELFGHEKGAFTGALQRRLGRFEAADGGTIFLDEVGDLPAETQMALLRVLQEREIERVGSSHPITVDVRVLAATNRDLDAAVESGTLRKDLYFRLNVFPIRMPPLRERVDDIPILVEYLVERYARSAGKSIRHIKKQTLELLQAYDWPGNVRELQNVIERAVVLCEGETFAIDESWLKACSPQPSKQTGRQVTTLAEGEKALIEAALAETHGRVSGPRGAAAKLGIPRQTLESKIKTLHIDVRAFRVH